MWQCDTRASCIYKVKWNHQYDGLILLQVLSNYELGHSFRWKTLPHHLIGVTNSNTAIVCKEHTEDPEVTNQALLDRLRCGIEDSSTVQDL